MDPSRRTSRRRSWPGAWVPDGSGAADAWAWCSMTSSIQQYVPCTSGTRRRTLNRSGPPDCWPVVWTLPHPRSCASGAEASTPETDHTCRECSAAARMRGKLLRRARRVVDRVYSPLSTRGTEGHGRQHGFERSVPFRARAAHAVWSSGAIAACRWAVRPRLRCADVPGRGTTRRSAGDFAAVPGGGCAI